MLRYVPRYTLSHLKRGSERHEGNGCGLARAGQGGGPRFAKCVKVLSKTKVEGVRIAVVCIVSK